MTDHQKMLALARDTARDAAIYLKTNLAQLCSVEANLERDVKVRADRELETFILSRLAGETTYPVLSEEEGGVVGETDVDGYCWIVDPLDGSLNFSRQIPICCISIALWQKDTPVLGIIYDFNRDELFAGLAGTGAWLNDVSITIGKVAKMSEAVLCTGFPVSTDFSRAGIETFVTAIQAYKKIRLLGSAALSLSYVACGRADAYCENNIKIWDVAAGIAIVEAAGGIVVWEYTEDTNRLNVEASNADLASIQQNNKEKKDV